MQVVRRSSRAAAGCTQGAAVGHNWGAGGAEGSAPIWLHTIVGKWVNLHAHPWCQGCPWRRLAHLSASRTIERGGGAMRAPAWSSARAARPPSSMQGLHQRPPEWARGVGMGAAAGAAAAGAAAAAAAAAAEAVAAAAHPTLVAVLSCSRGSGATSQRPAKWGSWRANRHGSMQMQCCDLERKQRCYSNGSMGCDGEIGCGCCNGGVRPFEQGCPHPHALNRVHTLQHNKWRASLVHPP